MWRCHSTGRLSPEACWGRTRHLQAESSFCILTLNACCDHPCCSVSFPLHAKYCDHECVCWGLFHIRLGRRTVLFCCDGRASSLLTRSRLLSLLVSLRAPGPAQCAAGVQPAGRPSPSLPFSLCVSCSLVSTTAMCPTPEGHSPVGLMTRPVQCSWPDLTLP